MEHIIAPPINLTSKIIEETREGTDDKKLTIDNRIVVEQIAGNIRIRGMKSNQNISGFRTVDGYWNVTVEPCSPIVSDEDIQSLAQALVIATQLGRKVN